MFAYGLIRPRFISYIFAILYEVVLAAFALNLQRFPDSCPHHATRGTRCLAFLFSLLKTKTRELLRQPHSDWQFSAEITW